MKTLLLVSLITLGIFAADKPVEVPDNLKLSYFKLKAKQLRLTDQYKQLQLAQGQIVAEFNASVPEIDKIRKEIKEVCESKKQTFLENVDEISCVAPEKAEKDKK